MSSSNSNIKHQVFGDHAAAIQALRKALTQSICSRDHCSKRVSDDSRRLKDEEARLAEHEAEISGYRRAIIALGGEA